MLGRATGLQAELAERMRTFFERYDYLACPVTQVEPFPVEDEYAAEIDGRPMGSYIEWMRSNSRISATCFPAISVPCGFSRAGLPVGLQLVARPFGERALLEVAHAIERRTGLGEHLPLAASACFTGCALGQFPLLDLASGGLALGELLDAELALDARTALELDGLVGHDLKVVAPGVEEVEAPRARVHDRQPLALDGRPYRVDVVDHEPEMALVVPRLPAALHESDELVAHVDERRAGRAATQLEIEEAPVQRERGIEIADLERHVVYADQLRPRLHGLKHRLAGMSTAGYSGTPLPRKLGIARGQPPAVRGCAGRLRDDAR